MQHVSNEELRRALRAEVCPTCPVRPKGSESLGALVARECEGTCTIFENLDALKAMTERFEGEALAGFERAIQNDICQSCTATASAGDYCSDRLHRTCPLSLQAAKVLEVLESHLAQQQQQK